MRPWWQLILAILAVTAVIMATVGGLCSLEITSLSRSCQLLLSELVVLAVTLAMIALFFWFIRSGPWPSAPVQPTTSKE